MASGQPPSGQAAATYQHSILYKGDVLQPAKPTRAGQARPAPRYRPGVQPGYLEREKAERRKERQAEDRENARMRRHLSSSYGADDEDLEEKKAKKNRFAPMVQDGEGARRIRMLQHESSRMDGLSDIRGLGAMGVDERRRRRLVERNRAELAAQLSGAVELSDESSDEQKSSMLQSGPSVPLIVRKQQEKKKPVVGPESADDGERKVEDENSSSDASSSDDVKDDITAQSNSRLVLRQQAILKAQRQQRNIEVKNLPLAVPGSKQEQSIRGAKVEAKGPGKENGQDSSSSEDGSSSSSDSSSSDDSSDDENDPLKQSVKFVKPTFVPRGLRKTDRENEAKLIQEEERKIAEARRKEQKVKETKYLVAQTIANERNEEEEIRRNGGKRRRVDEEDSEYSLDSEVDETPEQYEKWKIRELERCLLLERQRVAKLEEFQDLERRRNMTEEEKLEEDRAAKLGVFQEKKERADFRSLQKYTHGGAYFQDLKDEEDEGEEDLQLLKKKKQDFSILKRDVNQPLDSEKNMGDRDTLPKSLQVKRGYLNLKGQTKYKGLRDADTTDYNSGWVDAKTREKRLEWDRRQEDKRRLERDKMREKMGQMGDR